MTKYPKISVIIPVYNASQTITNCVKSILASDYPNFEVIVVDDASTDDSTSIASSLPCRLLVLDRNSGPGIARNKGAKVASGEIIAFTDADCEVPQDWLKKIVKNFENHDIGAVSGGYFRSISRGLTSLFQFYDTCFRQRNVPKYINSCIASNFACKKKIFDQIGGFPSHYVNEDIEFSITLSNNYKILWDKNNGVGHNFNNSLRSYFAKQILWAEAVARLYLSELRLMAKKTTWHNADVYVHLIFTCLLYLSFIAIFWNLFFIAIFSGLLVLYFVINICFIRFVAKKEGCNFSLKLFPLVLIRNTAWLLGIIRAIFKHLGIILGIGS